MADIDYQIDQASHIVLSYFNSYKTIYFRLVMKDGNLAERVITRIENGDEKVFSHIRYRYAPKPGKEIKPDAIKYNDIIRTEKEVMPTLYQKKNTIRPLLKELLKMGFRPYV